MAGLIAALVARRTHKVGDVGPTNGSDLVSVNRASEIHRISVGSFFGAMMIRQTNPFKSKAMAKTLLR